MGKHLQRLTLGLVVCSLLVGCSAAPSPAAPSANASAVPKGIQPLATRVSINMIMGKNLSSNLPIMRAVDNGAFAKAGLDVKVEGVTDPTAVLPMMARGDLDMSITLGSPAFFNAAQQGFGIKIISSANQPKPGRAYDTWIMVQKDQADKIKNLADLKGKTIEAAVLGTPLDLLVAEAVRQAGLSDGKDVTITRRARALSDFVLIARSKAADAMVTIEPLATQLEKDGLMVKWKGYGDIMPWYQPSLLAVSRQFMQKSPPAVSKFLEVLAVSAREVNAADGVWTDELVNIVAKWSTFDPLVIKAQGGVPYTDPNLTVSIESLQRTQDIWVGKGLVTTPVDVKTLVDAAPLEAALKNVGK